MWDTLISPTGSAFAAAVLALVEAAEAEGPLAVLSPLVIVGMVAVAACALQTRDVGSRLE